MVACRFAIDVCTNLHPRRARPVKDADVTVVCAVAAVVGGRPDCHSTPVAGEGNGRAAKVTSRFAVDVCAHLNPSRTRPVVDANVASVSAVAVVLGRSNRHTTAVAREGDVIAAVMRRLAVDVCAHLNPRRARPVVDSDMTGVNANAVPVIKASADCHATAVTGEGDGVAAPVTSRFAIDVGANLNPSRARPVEDANVTVAAFYGSIHRPDCHATTVAGEGNGHAAPLTSRFAIDVGPDLNPRCARPVVNADMT